MYESERVGFMSSCHLHMGLWSLFFATYSNPNSTFCMETKWFFLFIIEVRHGVWNLVLLFSLT